jgi:hypothetical protein
VALILFAVQSSHLGAIVAAIVFGVVIAIAGHIIRSRMLILTGLLIIGLLSAYFSFVLQPSSQ